MEDSDLETTLYVTGGLALGALLWWLFKQTPAPPARMTVTKEVAPLEPPAELPSVGAVAVRFDEVRELYKMGYLGPSMAIAQTEDLRTEMAILVMNGSYEKNSAEALVARMDAFVKEARAFQASMTSSPGV